MDPTAIDLDAPATIAKVNAVLKACGREERLQAGHGHEAYFWEGEAVGWFETTVGVPKVSYLTVRQHLESFELMPTQGIYADTPITLMLDGKPLLHSTKKARRNPVERCFQCGKKLGKNPHLVDTRDAQIVAVGNECFKHIVAAGEKGWRHPKHKSGLKCWVIDENTTDEYGDPRNNPGVQHRIREDQGDGFRIDTDFGFIQYRPVDGDNEIWWIESKKKGGGTQLMDLMVEHHPCETVSWGATSQAGQSFREKWHNAHPDIQDATDGERIPFDSQFDPYEDDSQFDPYEDED